MKITRIKLKRVNYKLTSDGNNTDSPASCGDCDDARRWRWHSFRFTTHTAGVCLDALPAGRRAPSVSEASDEQMWRGTPHRRNCQQQQQQQLPPCVVRSHRAHCNQFDQPPRCNGRGAVTCIPNNTATAWDAEMLDTLRTAVRCAKVFLWWTVNRRRRQMKR